MNLTITFANGNAYSCSNVYIERVNAYKTDRPGVRFLINPEGVSLDELNGIVHDITAVASIEVRNNDPVQETDANGDPIGEPFIATETLQNYVVPGTVALSVEETEDGTRYVVRLGKPTKAENILLQIGYTDLWGEI